MKSGMSRVAISLICVLGLLWSGATLAGAKIRMYEINKKQQQRKIMIGDKVEEPGCHNLLWSKEIYRFAQFGYAWCSLYTEKDCASDSLVPAFWEKGDYHKYSLKEGDQSDKLYPGEKWIVVSEGKEIKSWYCEAR